MKSFSFALLSLTLISLFAGCDEAVSKEATATIDTWLPLRISDKELEIQVPITSTDQRKGLMYRKDLGTDQGMLFPYKPPQQLSFWMANTKIPLDIGFFDQDGILREIHRMYPNDLNSTKSSSTDLNFALEMNQGWFRTNGIKVGDQLDLTLLAEALRKRGEDPAEYGLGPN